MPSAEEDHDHDLPCYTRRRSDYHHRWIFWAVNAAPRYRPFNLLVHVYERNRRERRAFSIDPLLYFSFADKSEEVAVAFVTAKRRQRPSPDKSARNNIGHLASSKSHDRRRLELRHCQRQQQRQQQQQWRSIAMLSTGLLSARAAPRPTDRRCILPSVTLTR